jgi:hypothetical protein
MQSEAAAAAAAAPWSGGVDWHTMSKQSEAAAAQSPAPSAHHSHHSPETGGVDWYAMTKQAEAAAAQSPAPSAHHSQHSQHTQQSPEPEPDYLRAFLNSTATPSNFFRSMVGAYG